MLSTAFQAASPTSAAQSAPVPECARLPTSERYDGSPGGCRSFLTQCQLIFNLQPQTFPTDVARVAYVITQLTGRAKRLGTAAWIANLPCLWTSEEFTAEMQRMFDRSATGLKAGRELLPLRQGHNTVSNYSIRVPDTGRRQRLGGTGCLVDAFLHGLAEPLVDRSRVSHEERERRQRDWRCSGCGEMGHFAAQCPVKDHAH